MKVKGFTYFMVWALLSLTVFFLLSHDMGILVVLLGILDSSLQNTSIILKKIEEVKK